MKSSFPSASSSLVIALLAFSSVAHAGFLSDGLRSSRSCLLERFHELVGSNRVAKQSSNRTSPLGVHPEVATAPPIRAVRAPGSSDELPSAARLESASGLDYDWASLSFRRAESTWGSFLSDSPLPGDDLGLPSQELSSLLRVRREQNARLAHDFSSVPVGTLSETSTNRIRYQFLRDHAPTAHAEVLRLIENAMMQQSSQEAPAFLRYLESVNDEVLLTAVRSPDDRIRSLVREGGAFPSRHYEEVIRRRVMAQGFPSPVHITEILSPQDVVTLMRAGAPFVDDVDRAIRIARQSGQVIPDLPTHGRLTHLVTFDYLGFVLREKRISPERLRETLQWVAQQDERSATATWGYLFDQAPGVAGTRGLSTPDVFHAHLVRAWGLTE